MASLEALAISGIRGYNPEKLERIDFTHPITLINGKNGSGKTTIIECLKYITTGVLPPSARAEKSFVMDPSIAGTPEVRGDIRLRFRTAKNRVVIAKKIIMVSKTQKGLTSKAVEQSLKTKDDDGKQIQVTQRCADIEKQIPEMLGISRAILDNIVFCHQDQSLWPFSDSNTLKGIFDQLFDTKRFTKAMENMKESLKDYQKQKTQVKGMLDILRTGYLRTIQNRSQHLNGLIEVVEYSEQLAGIKKQLDPLRQKLKQISSKQSVKNDLISSKGVIQYKVIDLNDKIQKIQQTANKEEIALKNISNEESSSIIKRIDSEILKIEKQIKVLQTLAQQIKDKQATQKRKIQFHMEVKRIKQILPELNDIYPATAEAVLKYMSEKLKTMKQNQKAMKDLKQKLNKLVIPSLPMQYEKQESRYAEQKMNKIKLQMEVVEKKIRLFYNKLYDTNVRQEESGINAESKRAAQKLSKLQAQIQMKKAQLKKYQEMKPRNKSIEQQIYEIKYTGIQLQKQMYQFVKRKRQCMLCMKKLTDQDMQDIRVKINKTVKKSQARIEELKRNYKPSDDIDPTPIIKEIESFIDSTNKSMRALTEEKQRYDRFVTSQKQIQLNKQLNRLMQGIQLKSAKVKMESSMQNQTIHIQRFRQLVNQYKIYASQYKGLLVQSARTKERSQKIQEIRKQHHIQISIKKDLEAKIQKLQNAIKNLDIIQNIYGKVEQLNQLIKRDEEKGSNSEESSSELINKIEHMEDEVRLVRKQKYCVELSMQHTNLSKQRNQLRQRLALLIQELHEITKTKNQNSELQNKKNNLQIEQAILSEKIKLKKSIHAKYLEQFPPYLIKLLRFNALSSMITDIQTSVKAMQRALNKVHNQKMDQINKILFDIWQEVYHAKDIQFIKINSISEKKSGYGYSIMMKKNGQLIQMKGRCSMGQKVLASLIIRMALAEAFSASTHILALDEPTTNLDRVHIQNLAQSISSILQMDQNSRFQLIIISHDMEFISLLKKHTNFYYQITRNQRNFSTIIKREISELNQEIGMPRLQAIHY